MKIEILLSVFWGIALAASAAPEKIRVTCIGDSITWGTAKAVRATPVPTVTVPTVKTGDYETKLDDGSVFAYRLVTEDPVKPGLSVSIVKANPKQTVRFAIPRQHWWRHVDAYSGGNWVEFLRDGRNYLTICADAFFGETRLVPGKPVEILETQWR